MSEVVGAGVIRLVGDNNDLKATIADSTRRVKALGDSIGNSTQAGAAKAQKAVEAYVQKLQQQAANTGKTASEIKLFELAQRGATQSQLSAAEAALKAIDAHKRQQRELRELASTATTAGSAAQRLAAPLAFVGSAVAGALAAVSGGSLLAGFNALVGGLDALNDAADATGSTIEKISALEQVALRTGTSLEASALPALDKLNTALRAKPDSDQARALKAIGLSADELRKLDPADALRAVAVALQGYADDGDKARLVQTLLGKSARELAPFLKDLAEKGELVAQVTSEQAAQAERFNQQLALLKTNTTNAGRSIAANMLPALNDMLTLVRELSSGPGLMASIGQSLIGNNFRTASDGLTFYVEKIRDIDARIATLRNDERPLVAAFNARQVQDLETQRAKLAQFADAYRNVVNAGSAGAGRGLVVPGATERPTVEFIESSAAGGAKRAVDAAQTELQNLRERLALLGKESTLERLNTEISLGKFGKLNAAQKLSLQYAAAAIDAANDEAAAVKTAADARDAATAALTRSQSANLAALATMAEENRTVRETIELLGADERAQAAIANARLQALITTREQQLAEQEALGVGDARLQQLQQEIDLLKERQQLNMERAIKTADQRLKETGEKATSTLATSIEDGILNGFRNSKSLGDIFLNELKAQFAKTVLRPVIQPVIDAGESAAGGLFAKLLGSVGSLFGGMSIDTSVAGTVGGITSGTVLPDILRGGRATGGPVERGGLYRVNERGPELLTVGGQQYLMMGAQGGHVTPNDKLVGGGAPTIINQTTGRVDKATMVTLPDGERALLLQEAADMAYDRMVGSVGDANSRFSRAMGRNYKTERRR